MLYWNGKDYLIISFLFTSYQHQHFKRFFPNDLVTNCYWKFSWFITMMWTFLLPPGIRQKSLLTQEIPCSIENLKNKRTKKNPSPMQFKRCKEMPRDSAILQECLCWSTWSMTGIIQASTGKISKNPTTKTCKTPNYAVIKTSLFKIYATTFQKK